MMLDDLILNVMKILVELNGSIVEYIFAEYVENEFHRSNKGFLHGLSMVAPWFLHRKG